MKNENIDVYKFGGSSLADSDCLRDVCDLIHQNTSDNIIISCFCNVRSNKPVASHHTREESPK